MTGQTSEIVMYRTPPRMFKAVENRYAWTRWPVHIKDNDRGEPTPRVITDDPVLKTCYAAYLEQRGRFMRHGEVPHDSKPITLLHAAELLHNANELIFTTPEQFVDILIKEFHLCEKARYVPPPYRISVMEG